MIVKWILYVILLLLAAVFGVYLYNIQVVELKDSTGAAPATTSFINFEGEKLAYREINAKAPTTVLFVGGLSAWSGTWERVLQAQYAKNKNFNYIAMDLPPFGYSVPSPNKNYFRDTQAARISALIEAKHIAKVIVVGHSYGGGPATEYAMQHKDKVVKLILVDAVLNIDEPKAAPAFSPLQISPLRTVLVGALVHNKMLGLSRLKSFVFVTTNITYDLVSTYTRYLDTRGATSRLSAWLGDYGNDPLTYASNDSANYKKLPFPVRLLWGNKDTLTPISGTQVLLSTIPNVKLQTLDNVGHIPMIENYELFDVALSVALRT